MTCGCDGSSHNQTHIRSGQSEVLKICGTIWEETIQTGVGMSEEEGGLDMVTLKKISFSPVLNTRGLRGVRLTL